MKYLKLILASGLFVFGGLLVCAFAMTNLAPSPVTAAKAHSIEHGWAADELTLTGFETSAKISGSNGTVLLKGEKPDRQNRICVELRKPLFATGWQVVGYDESHEPTDRSED
ncbi:hypothetical protein Pla22_51980 [Rubripirellula amarantea]|uniref:Uncharacterized protein n=1 Tax=Rubripirellula amarantea TaxID=2527999 RepID=A0A5C5WDX9_9BACT|nr:hypothetical protein [Rubripirellula amarantea]TWT47922.1 hypothetical protein Pla22_51980 [Rubripirellula amarantea]